MSTSGSQKAVVVYWLDSTASSGWGHHIDDAPSDLRCITVGLLIRRDEKSIILALNASPYSYGETIEIPMCAVRKIRMLGKV